MNLPSRLDQKSHRAWALLSLAVKKFLRIDGTQWAGAFAFQVFFSLFPLIILLVTIASFFVDRDSAGKEVIAYMESYVPISGEMQHHIFDTIASVIETRRHASGIAFLILIWGALRCFLTLISATNRAWDTTVQNWWRMPLKSLVLLGITAGAVLLGMAAQVLARMTKDWLFPGHDFLSRVYALGSSVIPLVVVFLSLSLFYRLAPRRSKRFADVWAATLFATVLLQAAESLFVIYFKNFATLNAVYGAFGAIMALLLWIYISGCIFIFGACLCAAQAEGGNSGGNNESTLKRAN
ncbi:MAG: YihY/virulence factor BrkB family protein [Proteobacteria bacterium]|nr:YihY/virulence factor BrkB family protein [Pseudomonadota bacterium]